MENDDFTSFEWEIRKDSAYFLVIFLLQQHVSDESVFIISQFKRKISIQRTIFITMKSDYTSDCYKSVSWTICDTSVEDLIKRRAEFNFSINS